MKMIVHDLSQKDFEALGIQTDTDIVISDTGTIKNCIGCFGCWIKTPGVCVLKDDYRNLGERLAGCDELLVISKCYYGSYSPFVRNVWDRSLPYLLPYFTTKNGETHHRARYRNRITYTACFYGSDITADERETAQLLVHANAKNFYANVTNISFCSAIQSIKETLNENRIN
jgi:multimeric flavodoxin WrbA